MENTNERIPAMRLTDNTTGVVYELDFNRDAIKFAEAHGFKPDEVTEFPVTRIPELWFYAFRKNHRNVARANADLLLEKKGGLTGKELERLLELYYQAAFTNVIVSEEDTAKNAAVTVEL